MHVTFVEAHRETSMLKFPFKRALKFFTINAVLLPLNLGVAITLTWLGLDYLLATAAGYIVHISLGFLLQRSITFNNPSLEVLAGMFRASLVEMVGIIIVLITTYVAVELFGFDFLLSRFIAVIVVGVWDYIAHSLFTFRTDPLH